MRVKGGGDAALLVMRCALSVSVVAANAQQLAVGKGEVGGGGEDGAGGSKRQDTLPCW